MAGKDKVGEKELIERLRRVPLFSNVSTKNLRTVVRLGKQLSWAEGKEGVVQGSRSHAFYLILDGGVEVTRDGKPVARLHTNDFFGEAGMISGGERNASVTATTPSDFFVLSRSGFAGALKSNQDLALQLMSAMVERQPSGSSY